MSRRHRRRPPAARRTPVPVYAHRGVLDGMTSTVDGAAPRELAIDVETVNGSVHARYRRTDYFRNLLGPDGILRAHRIYMPAVMVDDTGKVLA